MFGCCCCSCYCCCCCCSLSHSTSFFSFCKHSSEIWLTISFGNLLTFRLHGKKEMFVTKFKPGTLSFGKVVTLPGQKDKQMNDEHEQSIKVILMEFMLIFVKNLSKLKISSDTYRKPWKSSVQNARMLPKFISISVLRMIHHWLLKDITSSFIPFFTFLYAFYGCKSFACFEFYCTIHTCHFEDT